MSGAWAMDLTGAWSDLVPASRVVYLSGAPEGQGADSESVPRSLLVAWYTVMARKVMQYITQSWPVDTARSLAGWYTSGPQVKNDVEYTSYVHDGLADRLFSEAVRTLKSEAQKVLMDILARSGTIPGTVTERAEQVQRLLVPSAAPHVGFTAAPTPMGVSAAEVARAPLALFTRRALTAIRAAEREAHRLWKAKRIGKDILDLIRARRLEEAISTLQRRGLREEARLIQSAATRASARITR